MRAALIILLALIIPASASAQMRFGITDPTPISSTDSRALGVSIQRQDVVWNGESQFTGTLSFSPQVDNIVSVYGRAWNVPLTGTEISRYCGFIASILARYDQIGGIVIWNEPDGKVGQSYSWPAGLGYGVYGRMVEACAPIIHSFGAWAIGPGMHPWLSDVNELINAIPIGQLDVFDIHIFGWQVDNELPGDMAQIRARFGDIPIWITEAGAQGAIYGYPAYYGTPGDEVDEDWQAEIVSRQMIWAYCDGASAWFNLLLYDEPNYARMQTGLIRPDGIHKRSYDAYAATAAAISSGQVNCQKIGESLQRIWTPDERLAQKLGEIGGWARDAYERSS